jgi:PAS domain S-box-containing protein
MLVDLDLDSPKTPLNPALPYVFGMVTVIAATMVGLLAQPVLGKVPPYIVYILPVMAAAAYGGRLPGLAATSASILAIIFVFLPHRSLDLSSELFLLLFLLDGVWISWLGERMRAAMRLSQRAQKETLDAHKTQQRILSSISDAFGALDAQWRFIYANRNLASLAGRTPETLVGEELWSTIPAFCETGPKQALKQVLETGTSATFEMFVPRVNRWYETSVYRLESGLSLCSRDITARRDAERVLRESEERLRLAPEAAMVGTWTNDLQDGRLIWSAELEKLFGLSPESFAGAEEAFLELIHRDDRITVQDAFARCKRDQALFETEFRYCRAAEETRWMLIRGRGYVDKAGRPSRLVGIGIDVTDQKRNDEKLRHTQRLESLGILAGGIAHDFNNLLLVIIGNADLASQLMPAYHPARTPLDEIKLAGNKAANLTRQMLAYSGKGHVEINRLQVSTVVRDIDRLVRSLIAKNVELRIDLRSGLPFIKADAGQMQQVIMNLVINAAEAIPENRQGTVWVRAYTQFLIETATEDGLGERQAPAGNYVTIEVEDTGIGMDEATRERIFEPFFTTKFLGRGLGLSAVLGIIHAHKGILRVDSTPGRGSRFQVLVAAESAAQNEKPLPEATSAPDLRGEGLILVVDDESSVRSLAGTILETYGYSVILAESGSTAVELARRSAVAPALVLLDLSMPGISAQQTIEQLRFVRPDVPILLSSGYDEGDVLPRFGNGRLFGFLHKPYTPMQLAEKVKAGITEAVARSSNAAPVEPGGSHLTHKLKLIGGLRVH